MHAYRQWPVITSLLHLNKMQSKYNSSAFTLLFYSLEITFYSICMDTMVSILRSICPSRSIHPPILPSVGSWSICSTCTILRAYGWTQVKRIMLQCVLFLFLARWNLADIFVTDQTHVGRSFWEMWETSSLLSQPYFRTLWGHLLSMAGINLVKESGEKGDNWICKVYQMGGGASKPYRFLMS